MKISEQIDACENALVKLRNAGIPASIKIHDQFLVRQTELLDTYQELYAKTKGDKLSILLFFDSVICTLTAWSPEDIRQASASRKRLKELSAEISTLANKLSKALSERDTLINQGQVGCDTHYSIVNLISSAAEENYRFKSWVSSDLRYLGGRFDEKYWPSIPSIVAEIGHKASTTEVTVTDEITEAALLSTRRSRADFCRALFKRVALEVENRNSVLPLSFNLKDESWAALVNCALDLDADDLVDGAYIKRQRQSTKQLECQRHN